MKVRGIIIDYCDKEEVLKVCPEMLWDDKYDEMIVDDSDYFFLALGDRAKRLNDITKDYMCGEDNGLEFYFSDKSSVVMAIHSIYPEFSLEDVDSDDYPMDYDYRRDK